jgi:DNA-binding CsgD family transcriptional regulator
MALADAAAAQGITKETARTVLKRIFAKMDVRRQAELVAKLHSLKSPSS